MSIFSIALSFICLLISGKDAKTPSISTVNQPFLYKLLKTLSERGKEYLTLAPKNRID